jgi:hypothetical protein
MNFVTARPDFFPGAKTENGPSARTGSAPKDRSISYNQRSA